MCKTCEVDGCNSPVVATGKRKVKNQFSLLYCSKHLARLTRNGSLDAKFEYNYGTTEERFWLYTDKRGEDDCWVFKRAPNKTGYSGIWDSEELKKKMAHRYSYEKFVGPIDESMVVMHKCDNRLCVNPRHLQLGTQKENVQDMLDKGRGEHCYKNGLLHPRSKLDADKVRFIRANSSSMTQEAIAKALSVTRGCVASVVNRKTWKHVD